MQEKIHDFIEKIRAAKSIAVMAHKNPDGDALCCVLAMARLIELNFGKRCICVYDGNIPAYLDNIPMRGRACYVEHIDTNEVFDLAILMDYGARHQIGAPLRIAERAATTVEIDHHRNDAPMSDLCINDDNAAATGVILFDIMRDAGWRYDSDVLDLLAVAILTDTGNFKFARDGAPLARMAWLVDAGVNIRHLMESMNNKPRKAVQVEARAAANAEFFYHGRLALAVIERRDYRNMDGRGELVLNLLAQIRGVEYIVLLKQQKENQIGMSIRSRGKAIDHIAAAFGGGGHMRAAGAVVCDSLENVRRCVVEIFKGE